MCIKLEASGFTHSSDTNGSQNLPKVVVRGQSRSVIWLETRQQLLKLSATDKSLQLSDGQLSAAVTVRNLGVQID